MTLTQLEIFVLVAEYQSFTLAAKHLGITQSAVSHALKSLESHWQVNLLIREQNQVELSHIGRQLLSYAKEMLNTAQIMQRGNQCVSWHSARDLADRFLWRISIHSFASRTAECLPPALSQD